MAKTAPRIFPAHAGFHWAITESFQREAKIRMATYQERKAKKEGVELPRPDPLKVLDFDPTSYAVKAWRDERRREKEWCEEARRMTTGVGMKPVDSQTTLKLYYGISRDGEGRRNYLDNRVVIQPEDRYHLPLLSSWQYGWQFAHNEELFDRPSFRRTSGIKESFFSRTGLPGLNRDHAEVPTTKTEKH